MKKSEFLEVTGGNWGRLVSPQQHHQPFADPPDSTDPKISASSNVTFTSSRSSTVRTLDSRTSWAPCRNGIKASAPSFWGQWVALTRTITRWSLLRHLLGLDSQRFNNLLPSFMLILSITLPNSSRRVLSSTIINSHQETVSGQACNPPDPHWNFPFFFGGGVLWYPVPKWLLFLN